MYSLINILYVKPGHWWPFCRQWLRSQTLVMGELFPAGVLGGLIAALMSFGAYIGSWIASLAPEPEGSG